MARHWVGPWIWDTSGPTPAWRAPDLTVWALDLRSLPDQAIPGTTTNGNGLFLMPDAAAPGTNYVEVPENFTVVARNRVRNTLQLDQPILAAGRRGFLLELLTRHAVVDGSTFCRPLMPNRRGRLRLRLDGDGILEDHEIDTGSVFWTKILACLHAQYRDYRERAGLTLPEDFHRRWLTVLLEKFRGRIADYHEFIPSDLPDESPLPHSTTLTESFNKADSDTLGPDQTWTEVRGTFEVSGNQCTSDAGARDTTVNGQARAEADLASDDHYSQVVRVNNPSTNFQGGGGMARFSSSANTGYGAFNRGDGSALGAANSLDKIVAGVPTALGTSTTAYTTNAIVKCECDGSTIRMLVNGNEEVSVTDTSITGNTRGGIYRYDNGNGGDLLFDNWEASDLAGGGGFVPFPNPRGMRGGMHRLNGGMQ